MHLDLVLVANSCPRLAPILTGENMKRTMLCFTALLLVSFAHAAKYDLGSPRLALIDDPVQVQFQGGAEASKEKFRQAIAFITASKDWSIASESDGRMELTRTVRGQHFVKVEL